MELKLEPNPREPKEKSLGSFSRMDNESFDELLYRAERFEVRFEGLFPKYQKQVLLYLETLVCRKQMDPVLLRQMGKNQTQFMVDYLAKAMKHDLLQRVPGYYKPEDIPDHFFKVYVEYE